MTALYEVDGLIFRISLSRPNDWAEVRRGEGWQRVFLTGKDVLGLLGGRALSREEAEALALEPN